MSNHIVLVKNVHLTIETIQIYDKLDITYFKFDKFNVIYFSLKVELIGGNRYKVEYIGIFFKSGGIKDNNAKITNLMKVYIH